MRKVFFFLIIHCCLSVYCQNDRKITVTYTLFIGEDDTVDKKSKDLRNAIKLQSGNLTFKLFINDSIAYYVDNNGIANENLAAKLATIKSKYIAPIYINSDKSIIFNNNPTFRFFKTNEYLVSKNTISNWSIKNESKIIDGKLCYKAIASDIDYGGKEKKSYEVIAWFCPQIPFSFGPVFYGNLPGLILEVSYLDIILIATRVEYKVDEKKILKPQGQKLITIDDYYNKMSHTIKEVAEEIEKQQK